MSSAAPVISVTDLRRHYGEVKAVDGVTFEVHKGEVFGLLGPNGAGKTTTIEILEGLNRADSGQISVLGFDPARQANELKERIGVQLQAASLYPDLTVSELVELFATFYARRLPAGRLIDQLGLEERKGALTKELSGGQRQRLSIALALVNDPEIIFLDEPTTG
ncbi:MAG: type transport system ATP-binding protein, partial [Chloroflexota bacterium]|nr:type transport system ATP-binding protein [Chloroflexota bacterium]